MHDDGDTGKAPTVGAEDVRRANTTVFNAPPSVGSVMVCGRWPERTDRAVRRWDAPAIPCSVDWQWLSHECWLAHSRCTAMFPRSCRDSDRLIVYKLQLVWSEQDWECSGSDPGVGRCHIIRLRVVVSFNQVITQLAAPHEWMEKPRSGSPACGVLHAV